MSFILDSRCTIWQKGDDYSSCCTHIHIWKVLYLFFMLCYISWDHFESIFTFRVGFLMIPLVFICTSVILFIWDFFHWRKALKSPLCIRIFLIVILGFYANLVFSISFWYRHAYYAYNVFYTCSKPVSLKRGNCQTNF